MNRHKSIYFLIGAGGSGFVALVTVPILTWFYSVNDVGVYGIFVITVTLLSTLFSLSLEQSVIREYFETDSKTDLISGAMTVGFFCGGIVSFLSLFIFDEVSKFIFSDRSVVGFSFLILTSFVFHVFRYQSLLLRMEMESLYFSMSQILQKIIFLFAVFMVAAFSRGVQSWYNLVFSHLFSLLFSCFFQAFFIKQINVKLKVSLSSNYISNFRKYMKYSFPLFFSCLIIWGMSSIDKYTIKYFSNEHELGIYINAFRMSAVLVLFQQLISTIWVPVSMRWYSSGTDDYKYKEVFSLVSFVVACAYISVCSLTPFLYKIISPSFYPSIPLVPIILIYPCFYILSEVSGVGLYFRKKTNVVIFITIITLISCIFLNFLLVSKFGALGASMAISLSYFIFYFLKSIFSMIFWINVITIKSLINIIIMSSFSCLFYLYDIPFFVSFGVVFIIFTLHYRNIPNYLKVLFK